MASQAQAASRAQLTQLGNNAYEHFKQNKFAQAFPLYLQCLRISEGSPPSSTTAAVFYNIVDCYYCIYDNVNAENTCFARQKTAVEP